MADRKIYSPWAFTENEEGKRKANIETYNEIKDKATIVYGEEKKNEVLNSTDKAVIGYCGNGYAHTKYKVIRDCGLTTAELALICDSGNLCFGYRVEGSFIIVYTD